MWTLVATWFVVVGGNGDGTSNATAFGTIQAALDVAQPGDQIQIGPGVYTESVVTKQAGTEAAPIGVFGSGTMIASAGRVLTVAHPHYRFDQVGIAGMGGQDSAVQIAAAATGTSFVEVTVRDARDCIAVAASAVSLVGVQLRGCTTGVLATGVTDLDITGSVIADTTADGIRLEPPWNRVRIASTDLRPMAAGIVAHGDAARAFLSVLDLEIVGAPTATTGITVTGDVVASIDRLTIQACATAFELHAPSQPLISNAIVTETATAIRYAGNIAVQLYSSTIGRGIAVPFVAMTTPVVFDAKNVLLRGAVTPGELPVDAGSLVLDDAAFEAAVSFDYRAQVDSVVIDRGVPVPVVADRYRTPRPLGGAHDVGAFEHCPEPCSMGEGDGAPTVEDGGGCCGANRHAPPWFAVLLVAVTIPLWRLRRTCARSSRGRCSTTSTASTGCWRSAGWARSTKARTPSSASASRSRS